MTAIPASSVRCQTMADGTLRVVLDVEPAQARDAFALFCAPGTAVALAALVPEHLRAPAPVSVAPEPVAEKPKGAEIAKWLGIRCNEPEFWTFLENLERVNFPIGNKDEAAYWVRKLCGVESRAEIDNDPEAAERFHRLIRGPYAKWCVANGVTG